MVTSSKLLVLIIEMLPSFFYLLSLPDITHKAYSGKNEQRLDTSCFYAFLCPPTSIKVSNLLVLSSHFSSDIIFC